MRFSLVLLTALMIAASLLQPGMAPAAVPPSTLNEEAYDALVRSLVVRVPVHNPEWTNFNEGDVVWMPRRPGPVFGSLITLTPEGHVEPAEPCHGCAILD